MKSKLPPAEAGGLIQGSWATDWTPSLTTFRWYENCRHHRKVPVLPDCEYTPWWFHRSRFHRWPRSIHVPKNAAPNTFFEDVGTPTSVFANFCPWSIAWLCLAKGSVDTIPTHAHDRRKRPLAKCQFPLFGKSHEWDLEAALRLRRRGHVYDIWSPTQSDTWYRSDYVNFFDNFPFPYFNKCPWRCRLKARVLDPSFGTIKIYCQLSSNIQNSIGDTKG